MFEGGLFDEAPMGEVPVPEVSSIAEQQDTTTAATAPSIHDDSDDDMGDHFGGAPSPMGGMRYIFSFYAQSPRVWYFGFHLVHLI